MVTGQIQCRSVAGQTLAPRRKTWRRRNEGQSQHKRWPERFEDNKMNHLIKFLSLLFAVVFIPGSLARSVNLHGNKAIRAHSPPPTTAASSGQKTPPAVVAVAFPGGNRTSAIVFADAIFISLILIVLTTQERKETWRIESPKI